MLTYDYITDFEDTLTVHIPASQHKLPTANLEVAIKVQQGDGRLIPYDLPHWWHVDPASGDVTVSLFTNRHRGVILLTITD
jgi:hypothetical protein